MTWPVDLTNEILVIICRLHNYFIFSYLFGKIKKYSLQIADDMI